MLLLFTKIFTKEYVSRHKEIILKLGNTVGYLPLATHVYAKQLQLTKQSPKSLLRQIIQSKNPLQELFYENKNLYRSIDVSFQSLEKDVQKVFLSLGIFEGKDFSLQVVAAIHTLSIDTTFHMLQKLTHASLLEKSTQKRYRLHPLMKQYIRQFPYDKRLLMNAEIYYKDFLEKQKRKNTKSAIYREFENIKYVFEECENIKAYKELKIVSSSIKNELASKNIF